MYQLPINGWGPSVEYRAAVVDVVVRYKTVVFPISPYKVRLIIIAV